MSEIRSFNSYMRERFGAKVWKLALDGGFTCPNRDGRCGYAGCAFCAEGSGSFARDFTGGDAVAVERQLAAAKALVAAKAGGGEVLYMAYFQAYSNTYGSPDKLRRLLEPLRSRTDIAAVALATRPDCLPGDVLAVLADFNRQKPVFLELGLQTIHEKTARAMNMGYTYQTFLSALAAARQAGLETVCHLIFGLPGESEAMMLETVRAVARLPLQGVKLHLLHVLEGTALAEDYRQGRFRTLEMAEWHALLAKIIPLLPPSFVIHRLGGDGPKDRLIAPLWTADKRRARNEMARFFREHPVIQGSLFRDS